MKNIRKTILLCMLCIVSIILAGGCGEKEKKKELQELKIDYSAEQMLLMGFSQKKEIEDIYTKKVWDIVMDEEGHTYREIFTQEMRNFFIHLKVLNQMAESGGIALSKEEREKAEKKSEEFYDSLLKENGELEGISKEDILDIFTEYVIARKLRDSLIDNEELEVSENEARIMQVNRIVLDDEETAKQVLFEVNAEDADFYAIARRRSLDKEILLKVSHEDLMPEVDKIVSLLADGEISDIIGVGGEYHIYQCVIGYDEKATMEKKAQMEKMRKDELLQKAYDVYMKDIRISIDEKAWEKFVKNINLQYEGRSFFESYREAF